MTEQQAKQIREMREQGIGYRSIALTVGLSRDIVRNFCKSRGLSGYGSALAFFIVFDEGDFILVLQN